jgi:hypothetical protein
MIVLVGMVVAVTSSSSLGTWVLGTSEASTLVGVIVVSTGVSVGVIVFF